MLSRRKLLLESAFDNLELRAHPNPLIVRRRLPRQMRKQELLTEQQLNLRERRERELGEEASGFERPKKRTNVEKRIAMMKNEEIKAGISRQIPSPNASDQVGKLLQNLRRSHEKGAPIQKWTNLANEVHYLVDELKTRELASVLMMFAEAGYVDTTQCTTAIVKRLTMRTDVTSCLMAMMALHKSAGKRATTVLEDLSATFIRLVFDKGVESPNAYNVNKMTFADLRLTAVALAKLPFLHDRLEPWFIDDLFNCLTEKVPHAKDPRTLLSIMYAAARLRVPLNHPCLIAIIPQIRLLLLSRVPTNIKDDFGCLDACYTLGYRNLTEILACHARRNLGTIDSLDELLSLGRKMKDNGTENIETWIPWCDAVDDRLRETHNDELYAQIPSAEKRLWGQPLQIRDAEKIFKALRRSLRLLTTLKAMQRTVRVADGVLTPDCMDGE